jgi:hypothetical protein
MHPGRLVGGLVSCLLEEGRLQPLGSGAGEGALRPLLRLLLRPLPEPSALLFCAKALWALSQVGCPDCACFPLEPCMVQAVSSWPGTTALRVAALAITVCMFFYDFRVSLAVGAGHI